MHSFKFTYAQFNQQFKTIEIKMPREFFMDNIRYKLANGQRNIPQVEVVNPSGEKSIFDTPGEFGTGIRYHNGGVNLKLVCGV